MTYLQNLLFLLQQKLNLVYNSLERIAHTSLKLLAAEPEHSWLRYEILSNFIWDFLSHRAPTRWRVSFFPYQQRPLPLAVFPTVAEEHSLQLTQGDVSVIDGVKSPCQWENIRSPQGASRTIGDSGDVPVKPQQTLSVPKEKGCWLGFKECGRRKGCSMWRWKGWLLKHGIQSPRT